MILFHYLGFLFEDDVIETNNIWMPDSGWIDEPIEFNNDWDDAIVNRRYDRYHTKAFNNHISYLTRRDLYQRLESIHIG